MLITKTVHVSYSQLAVFDGALSQPFNDWTDQHVAQGFSWRPGSVSFRALVESGLHRIFVRVVQHLGEVEQQALRVIEVPFQVPPGGTVEIGSISDLVVATLPAGRYLLRCEFLPHDEQSVGCVRLTFAARDHGRFAVLRSGDAGVVVGDLLTTAEPAAM